MRQAKSTKYITLIGRPLDQSFAARMQNAAYTAMGLNICYFYTETGTEHLQEIIDGVRSEPSFLGCAVTKPNKVDVIRYLDGLDPLCRKIGACNTVVKTPDNRLIGFNTDIEGFLHSIEDKILISGISAYCIGAGGAGRAVCFALSSCGAERILIEDKERSRANALSHDINAIYGNISEAVSFGDFSDLSDCTLLINASGVGMGETKSLSPISPEYLHKNLFCYDTCYNPEKTEFLLNAESRGCKIMNGLEMAICQGASQIKLWTGISAPLDVMRSEVNTLGLERRKGK